MSASAANRLPTNPLSASAANYLLNNSFKRVILSAAKDINFMFWQCRNPGFLRLPCSDGLKMTSFGLAAFS
jgi:hypothetical protein